MSRRSLPGLFPNQVWAIAKNTFRESVRSRVFYILLAFAVSLLVFSYVLGFLAAGVIRKMVLDVGLSTIAYFSALTAIFVGIGLVYQEVEKKTIYNILSKPVSRTRFILGRYLGLLLVLLVNLAAMVAVLSAVLFFVEGFTPRILAAASCIFLELMVLTAVAVFFSSVASPVVSALCTAAFYVIGHTSSALPELLLPAVESPLARKVILALYHLLPDLNLLSINNLVAHDIPVAPGFYPKAVAYTLLLVSLLLVASALSFERRDLV
jgi:ABC-type transport system involved in multi-copper enzyme maturation permease subunit